MQNESARQAVLFYTQSAADLRLARASARTKKYETALLMCVQAAMNRLNSVCISLDRYQNPTYNLTDMLKICAKISPRFDTLREECGLLDGIQDFKLFAGHTKGGRAITPPVMQRYCQAAERILQVSRVIITEKKLFPIPETLFEKFRRFLLLRRF